jgi:hypothetical protein
MYKAKKSLSVSFFRFHFNIILALLVGLPSGIYSPGFVTKPVCCSPLPYACYIPYGTTVMVKMEFG